MQNLLGCKSERVNLSGGTIVLEHLLSGSGARMVVALIHEMKPFEVKSEVASLCVGGGQGTAICLKWESWHTRSD